MNTKKEEKESKETHKVIFENGAVGTFKKHKNKHGLDIEKIVKEAFKLKKANDLLNNG